MSPYAVTKLATESYALAYGFSYGLEALALRFFNVYGPRQRADHDYAAVIPRFLGAALSEQKLSVHGDGTQSRDFTYVETVSEALLRAVEGRLSSSTPINLAFGTKISLNELVEGIQSHLSHPVEVEFTEARAGDVKYSQADPTMMNQLFPNLTPVSLEVGLMRTLAWMRNESKSAG